MAAIYSRAEQHHQNVIDVRSVCNHTVALSYMNSVCWLIVSPDNLPNLVS